MSKFAELNEYFREALLETVPCSVFIVNSDREIIFWNRSAAELTGYSAREMVGKSCSRVHLTLCVSAEGKLDGLCPLQGGGVIGESECEIQRKDGSVVPVIRRSRPVYDGQGQVIGAIEALVDVSLIKKARTEIRLLKHELAETGRFGRLIGKSEKMRKLYSLIEMVAASDASVVVEGETGTGKELVAKTIHEESERGDNIFLAVNCGAIPEGLVEAELFGHRKGAFTGATSDRQGCFETACGGTLFLDEAGELPEQAQVKLLRVLQEGEVTRVGESTSRKVDVRVIAATNRRLDELVKSGKFRSDLYYRLRVVGLQVPALRERREDIPDLVAHFISVFNKKYERNVRGVSTAAMNAMNSYDWPGNVRQLEHAIEHGFVVSGSDEKVIGAENLPAEISAAAGHSGETAQIQAGKEGQVSLTELEQVKEALEKSGGNKTRAAELLGITRAGLYKKINRLGL